MLAEGNAPADAGSRERVCVREREREKARERYSDRDSECL